MAAILGECNSESNRTPCKVSVVSILLVQQRGNFRIGPTELIRPFEKMSTHATLDEITFPTTGVSLPTKSQLHTSKDRAFKFQTKSRKLSVLSVNEVELAVENAA